MERRTRAPECPVRKEVRVYAERAHKSGTQRTAIAVCTVHAGGWLRGGRGVCRKVCVCVCSMRLRGVDDREASGAHKITLIECYSINEVPMEGRAALLGLGAAMLVGGGVHFRCRVPSI